MPRLVGKNVATFLSGISPLFFTNYGEFLNQGILLYGWTGSTKLCWRKKVFGQLKCLIRAPGQSEKFLTLVTLLRIFWDNHIGPNSSFKFWLDPWVRCKPLVLTFPHHIVSTAESSLMVCINNFLHNGVWSLPRSFGAHHVDLMELRNLIGAVQVHDRDHLTWNGLKAKNVSIATIWHSLRNTATTTKVPCLRWFGLQDLYQSAPSLCGWQ